LLVIMVICLPTRCSGSCFVAIAIAASSAVYGFCSVLVTSVAEHVIGSLPVTLPSVSWMALLIVLGSHYCSFGTSGSVTNPHVKLSHTVLDGMTVLD